MRLREISEELRALRMDRMSLSTAEWMQNEQFRQHKCKFAVERTCILKKLRMWTKQHLELAKQHHEIAKQHLNLTKQHHEKS